MGDRLEELHREFDTHDDFEPENDGYRVTSTPFDVEVCFSRMDEQTIRYRCTCTVPSLEAVIENETISPVLLEGWADPMERRLQDVDHATSAIETAAVTCSWDREQFDIEIRFTRPADAPVPTDAIVAIVGYIEGTYLEGVIPGYQYGPPVDAMLASARERAERTTD